MPRRTLFLFLAILIGFQPLAATAQDASPSASPAGTSGGFSEDTLAFLDVYLSIFEASSPGVVFYFDSPEATFHEARGVATRNTGAAGPERTVPDRQQHEDDDVRHHLAARGGGPAHAR